MAMRRESVLRPGAVLVSYRLSYGGPSAAPARKQSGRCGRVRAVAVYGSRTRAAAKPEPRTRDEPGPSEPGASLSRCGPSVGVLRRSYTASCPRTRITFATVAVAAAALRHNTEIASHAALAVVARVPYL